jgi:hypothetical protein
VRQRLLQRARMALALERNGWPGCRWRGPSGGLYRRWMLADSLRPMLSRKGRMVSSLWMLFHLGAFVHLEAPAA